MIEKKGSILSVREDIKVFDCTIRDGGLVNNYHFSDEFVKAHYETCLAAGVDYMEIGKNVSPTIMSEAEYGPWNFCKEEDIRRIVGENKTNMKIAVMSDIGRSLKEELRPKSESVVDMIRIATYIHQIPAAIELIEDAHAKGYETTVNIMAISKSFDDELDEVLEQLSKTNVDVIYIADSFGSFYPEQIKKLTEKYLSFAQKTGKKVGIHAHNNLQLAYANTLEAMIYGTSFLDVTISGLGRGAGNCPLELLIGFLKNPKYKLTPVLKFIEEYIVPLEKELDWGYSIPYMITGQ
ncbi:aldolase catalytic domain-containing protein, partial [Aliarcobacter butzleri]